MAKKEILCFLLLFFTTKEKTSFTVQQKIQMFWSRSIRLDVDWLANIITLY